MGCRKLVIIAAWLLSRLVASEALAEGVDLWPRFELGAKTHYVSQGIIEHEVLVEPAKTPNKIQRTARMPVGINMVSPTSLRLSLMERRSKEGCPKKIAWINFMKLARVRALPSIAAISHITQS